MKRRFLPWIAVLLGIPPLGLIVTPPVKAAELPVVQDTAGKPASQDDEAPLSDKNPRPLGDILRRMSRAAGVQIVTDSRTSKMVVPPPADPTTSDNYLAQIAALVKALPSGTEWGKVMLPNHKGRFDGDAVAAYVDAEAKLFGHVGERTKPGEVEILGQRLAEDKAEVHITGLNLVPVYLITNSQARTASVPADPNQWANLSPQEKRQYAHDQAAQLANADPNLRNAIAQQYFMIFNQLLTQLPQADRQSLFSGMSGPGENVKVILRTDSVGGKLPPNVIVAPGNP